MESRNYVVLLSATAHVITMQKPRKPRPQSKLHSMLRLKPGGRKIKTCESLLIMEGCIGLQGLYMGSIGILGFIGAVKGALNPQQLVVNIMSCIFPIPPLNTGCPKEG